MEFRDFLSLISEKRKAVWGFMALFLMLGALLVAVQKFQYSSKSQLLVVQQNNQLLDAYAASRSNEYLSGILASVISSNSFYTKVMESNFGIDKAYFGDNTRDQMEIWSRTVKARNVNDSGIISIVVYHPDRAQAEKIVSAVNYVLMTQHASYHGAGQSVKVRLIDQPVTSSFPVKPNIPLVAVSSLALGVLVSLIYIYLSVPPAARLSRPEFHELTPGIPSRALRESLSYFPPQEIPSPRPLAHHPDDLVRGQLPEDAVATLEPTAAHKSYHQPHWHTYRRPATVTRYGQYAQVNLRSGMAGELSYSSDPGEFEGPGNEIAFKGNMKNLLS